jgi:hypothetical protein
VSLDLFAGVPVADYEGALAWYERFFGKPATMHPHDTEAVWELEEHRHVYVALEAEHAGHARITLFLEDFEDWVEGIAGRGIEPAKQETYSNGIRKSTYRDPEGNEIGLGGAPVG